MKQEKLDARGILSQFQRRKRDDDATHGDRVTHECVVDAEHAACSYFCEITDMAAAAEKDDKEAFGVEDTRPLRSITIAREIFLIHKKGA